MLGFSLGFLSLMCAQQRCRALVTLALGPASALSLYIRIKNGALTGTQLLSAGKVWIFPCSGAPFPLTPALSLGEREPRWRVLEDPWRLERLHRLKQLSLPEGPSGIKKHSVPGAERSRRFGLANSGEPFSLSP